MSIHKSRFFPSLKHCQKKLGPSWTNYCALVCYSSEFFPTCQVRVVRFYPSCCPPSSPSSSSSSSPLLLLASSSSFSSTMSASTSTSTSALPTLRQALRQLPSSVRTAGPQPGSFPAQCAPLDLNLGASQLSVRRWTSTWDLPSSVCTAGTSTWDLPSSVCTAGPQPGTFPAQCAPLDLNGQIECQKICQIECQIECQKICQIKCDEICQRECQKICQIKC